MTGNEGIGWAKSKLSTSCSEGRPRFRCGSAIAVQAGGRRPSGVDFM
jgi:hypothetical protein